MTPVSISASTPRGATSKGMGHLDRVQVVRGLCSWSGKLRKLPWEALVATRSATTAAALEVKCAEERNNSRTSKLLCPGGARAVFTVGEAQEAHHSSSSRSAPRKAFAPQFIYLAWY